MEETNDKVRCPWVKGELDTEYHDTEWGRKTHDERELFEYLILEGMQAGLKLVINSKENERTLKEPLIILTIIFARIIAMTT